MNLKYMKVSLFEMLQEKMNFFTTFQFIEIHLYTMQLKKKFRIASLYYATMRKKYKIVRCELAIVRRRFRIVRSYNYFFIFYSVVEMGFHTLTSQSVEKIQKQPQSHWSVSSLDNMINHSRLHFLKASQA